MSYNIYTSTASMQWPRDTSDVSPNISKAYVIARITEFFPVKMKIRHKNSLHLMPNPLLANLIINSKRLNDEQSVFLSACIYQTFDSSFSYFLLLLLLPVLLHFDMN